MFIVMDLVEMEHQERLVYKNAFLKQNKNTYVLRGMVQLLIVKLFSDIIRHNLI